MTYIPLIGSKAWQNAIIKALAKGTKYSLSEKLVLDPNREYTKAEINRLRKAREFLKSLGIS